MNDKGQKKRIIPYIDKKLSKAMVVLRQEHKYLIDIREFSRGISICSKILMKDSNNGKNGYMVRSLYFDTLYDSDYNDKIDGLDIRKKIRLRVYNHDDDYAKLEVKRKQNNHQIKRSLKISRNHAQELCNGEYVSLLSYDDPFALECYMMLQSKAYRPKVIVQYKRVAFVGQGQNNIRVTFDHDIRATELDFDIFRRHYC